MSKQLQLAPSAESRLLTRHLNQIIYHTKVDEPIRLRRWHNGVSAFFALVGLALYYENLDEPTTIHLLTDYVGVLGANFACIFFAGREYFKDRLEREVPDELKGILVPQSNRNTLIAIGALAAGSPYSAMALATADIRVSAEGAVNQLVIALYVLGTWLVNAFMSTIPVRVLLEDVWTRWGLFWFILGPMEIVKAALKKCGCIQSPRHQNPRQLESQRSFAEARAIILDKIDQAREGIKSLGERELITLYSSIYEMNYSTVGQPSDYLDEIITQAMTPSESVSMSLNQPLLVAEEKNRGLLNQHSITKLLVILLGAILAVIILLADSQYVKDTGEAAVAKWHGSKTIQQVVGWVMLYAAMSVGWLLAREFCSATFQYGIDTISGFISSTSKPNIATRFYPKHKILLNIISLYMGIFSSASGVKMYSQKISSPVLVGITNIGIKIFNSRALLGLTDDSLQTYAEQHGERIPKYAASIDSFFKLLKVRVDMIQPPAMDSGEEMFPLEPAA